MDTLAGGKVSLKSSTTREYELLSVASCLTSYQYGNNVATRVFGVWVPDLNR